MNKILFEIASYIVALFGTILAIFDFVLMFFTVVGGLCAVFETGFNIGVFAFLLIIILFETIYIGIYIYVAEHYCSFTRGGVSNMIENIIYDVRNNMKAGVKKNEHRK